MVSATCGLAPNWVADLVLPPKGMHDGKPSGLATMLRTHGAVVVGGGRVVVVVVVVEVVVDEVGGTVVDGSVTGATEVAVMMVVG